MFHVEHGRLLRCHAVRPHQEGQLRSLLGAGDLASPPLGAPLGRVRVCWRAPAHFIRQKSAWPAFGAMGRQRAGFVCHAPLMFHVEHCLSCRPFGAASSVSRHSGMRSRGLAPMLSRFGGLARLRRLTSHCGSVSDCAGPAWASRFATASRRDRLGDRTGNACRALKWSGQASRSRAPLEFSVARRGEAGMRRPGQGRGCSPPPRAVARLACLPARPAALAWFGVAQRAWNNIYIKINIL